LINPCEECIRYAICKPKKSIDCNPLTQYFNIINAERDEMKMKQRVNEGLRPLPEHICSSEKDKAWNETWDIIREYLPNLKGIYTEAVTSQHTGISGKVSYLGKVGYW